MSEADEKLDDRADVAARDVLVGLRGVGLTPTNVREALTALWLVGYRARATEEATAKAEFAKECAGLIAKAQAALRVTTFNTRRDAHDALDKLSALLGLNGGGTDG